MRTSHVKIKSRIRDEKSKITDKQLFTSSAYAGYLSDIASAIAHRYKRNVLVKTIWDERENAEVASTDNRRIKINCANFLTKSFPSRPLRADSIMGLCGHELGHILYTSFTLSNIYNSAMLGGKLYPKPPSGLNDEESESLAALQTVLESDDKPAKLTLLKIAHDLMNILEDVYVEERMSYTYPGFGVGIQLNNQRFAETVPSLKKQVEEKNYDLSVMINIMIQYCTTHTINNLEQYEGSYLDRFYPCVPLIDGSVYSSDAKKRYNAVNHILILWWDYVSDYIEHVKKEVGEKMITKAADKREPLSDDEVEAIIGEVLDVLGEQIAVKSSTPIEKGAAVKEPYKIDKDAADESRKHVLDVIEERFPKSASKSSEIGDTGADDSIDYVPDYKGTGYEHCADDIERMLTKMAEEHVYEELERERERELTDEAESLSYSAIHKGTKITVYRKSSITPSDIEKYNRVATPLLKISKELQKRVSQIIKDNETGGKRSGLYMGRRFDARATVRNDGRLFYNRKAPCDNAQIAVLLLVDESGSMSGDRATMARAASIVLYDFCHGLHIPLSVIGHSGDQVTDKSLELYSYADFHAVDNNDKYRLMDISARLQNRDGAALRFAADQLAKRPEPYKLLIVISDGEPCASGYRGNLAESDMRTTIKEYARKGVITFGAAIGSDRADIKRIYGENFFLDITDLKELPCNLAALISKYIKRTA